MQTDLDALIRRARESDGVAAEELFALLYDELHRLAEHTLHRDGGHSPSGQPPCCTRLTLKLAGRDGLAFDDRTRFFAYAARAMRTLVIDYARQRRAIKRGTQFEVTLDDNIAGMVPAADAGETLVRIGEGLVEITAVDASLAELVDLHFFGGFTLAEIASFRGVSERTVQRDWRKARLLLRHAIPEDTD